MSRGLADSFLRYNHGEWIDCDGDPVEIELVVHAHWVSEEGVSGGDGRYMWAISTCSRCGGMVRHAYANCNDKYCKHCGAHMDEEVAE